VLVNGELTQQVGGAGRVDEHEQEDETGTERKG